MSEIDSRPTRGRTSTRGGRGSYGRGGPRGGRKQVNGHASETPAEESYDDQGELGEMKKKYSVELGLLKDMFPDWTDTDLVFALEEADGDIPATVDKITQGAVSQFSEVKKPKDRARSKVKEDAFASPSLDKAGSGSRARGRAFDSTRGGRGRATERGRGGHRGGRGGHATTNGIEKDSTDASVPTTESSAWGQPTTTETSEGVLDTLTADPGKAAQIDSASASQTAAATAPAAAATQPGKGSAAPEAGAKKSWASMFAQPKPVPAPIPKKAPAPVPQPAPVELPAVPAEAEEPTTEPETTPAPAALETSEETVLPHELPAERPATSDGDALELTPSNIPLTEENVEHLPDSSIPPATLTAASTAGSLDPRNLTPLPQAPIGRPSLGGYATSANRLAGTGARSASFQRRVKEQQEAVVMPGHSAVDRAAVQFGSLGLNGESAEDVDEEREDPETRQAPQHSPPSQPRASLPPAPRPAADQPEVVPATVAVPTPKQAPGLPPASAQNQQQIQDPSIGQGLSQDTQSNQFSQFGRYGQPGLQQDIGAQAQQKQHYDPFGHQSQQGQYDQYGMHQQQHAQQQQAQQAQQQQSPFGGLSSAPTDYSSYYTSDQNQQRYNQYYGASYAPQDTRSQSSQNQQDPAIGQQRSASGFGSGPNDSAFGSQTQHQAQSRFGDAHAGSGNNTPNPSVAGQHHQQNAQQAQQLQQQQQHQQHGGFASAASGYPYGHQYYNSPYPQAYQNQINYTGYNTYQTQGKQAYGGNPYSGGQGMGSHGYESSSPAPGGQYGQGQQTANRAASGSVGLGGLDDYNRGSGSQGFGSGINEAFPRSGSSFGQGYGQQNLGGGAQQDAASDALKPFGSETGVNKTGPSPRPGSAVGSQQSGNLPPPQSHQQQQGGAFGGYSGFPGQQQYLGGLGAQQSGQSGYGAQNQSYGSYGGFSQTYGQSYGGGNARGGWGQNYGQGQH